jgi:hypothetical protein
MRFVIVLALLAACDSGGTSDPGTDGGNGSGSDAGSNTIDGGSASDGGASNRIHSTLTSACATLQGRAIVNFNGNLGIAFTEDDSPFTFLGSVQFELPDGFTGAIPNPEAWNGSGPRKVVAMTTPSYELHGNHCWMSASPSGGSITVTEYHPNNGVVKATFASLPLRSCTGSSVCTLSGTIETTGEGVFD